MSSVRVAVVTGSNKGIGLAVVKQLCEQFEGVVYLTARDEGRGKEAVEELRKQGANPEFHQLDITNVASIEKFRDHIRDKHGRLDVLVNNAAIAYKNRATEPFAEQAVNTINTNFTSTLNVCKLLFPLLTDHARVVNISSMLGQLSAGVKGDELKQKFKSDELTEDALVQLMQEFVEAAKVGDHLDKGWGNSTYSMSKVGITALTRVQQRQFDKDSRRDIIVTAPEPGYVVTDMTSRTGNLTPDQGAEPIVFCALLPHDANDYKGAYVSQQKQILTFE